MLETEPSHIKDNAKASLKIEAESIKLEPLLLNSRNSVTLKALIAQTPLTREFSISAHIAGVNQIHNFHRFPPIIISLARIFTFCSYILFLAFVIYIILSKYENNIGLKLFYLLFVALCASAYIIAFIIFGSLFYSSVYKTRLLYSVRYLISKLVILLKRMIYGDNF